MTEAQKKQELIAAEAQEIQSLNFDGLDVTELEKRLETISIPFFEECPSDGICYSNVCAGYVPICGVDVVCNVHCVGHCSINV